MRSLTHGHLDQDSDPIYKLNLCTNNTCLIHWTHCSHRLVLLRPGLAEISARTWVVRWFRQSTCCWAYELKLKFPDLLWILVLQKHLFYDSLSLGFILGVCTFYPLCVDIELQWLTIQNSVCRSSSLDPKNDQNWTEPNCKILDHQLQLHWSWKSSVASCEVCQKVERLKKTGYSWLFIPSCVGTISCMHIFT